MPTFTHTYIHTYTHTSIHTHTHTCIYILTRQQIEWWNTLRQIWGANVHLHAPFALKDQQLILLGMSRAVAGCCRVLQGVAVCCGVLQCAHCARFASYLSGCCSVLQCVLILCWNPQTYFTWYPICIRVCVRACMHVCMYICGICA